MNAELTRSQLENIGSLITVKGTNTCLGPLFAFSSGNIFDATYGKVPITKEESEAHNKAFDKAIVEGLDENCQIGQIGTFYYNDTEKTVKTFNGTLVSSNVRRSGPVVTFFRNGKTFRGRVQKDAECINFKRIE